MTRGRETETTFPGPASQGRQLARPSVCLSGLDPRATSRFLGLEGSGITHWTSPFSRAAWKGVARELSDWDPERTPSETVFGPSLPLAP